MSAVIVDVAGANIGRDTTPEWAVQTQRAFQLLRRAKATPQDSTPHRPRVALAQEVNDDDRAPEWSYARHTFPPAKWNWWPEQKGPGALVPVATPAEWEVNHHLSAARFLSPGRAHISPTRYMTVKVTHVPGLTQPIGWASFQLVAGAWTNPGQTAEAWRRKEWADGSMAVEDALRWYRDLGVTVVGSCDSNKPGAWDFHLGGFRRIVTHGLDMLWMVQGHGEAVQVDVRRTSVVPMPIDGHSLLVATLALG